jgi:hypothetical protein
MNEMCEKDVPASLDESEPNSSAATTQSTRDLEKEGDLNKTATVPAPETTPLSFDIQSEVTRSHPNFTYNPSPSLPIILDWTGPDDLRNPHNWPTWKKVWHSIAPALCGLVVYASSGFIQTWF